MDYLRKQTLEYIANHGSKRIWFSQKLKCSLSHFSLFLKGERDLGTEREQLLKNILSKG